MFELLIVHFILRQDIVYIFCLEYGRVDHDLLDVPCIALDSRREVNVRLPLQDFTNSIGKCLGDRASVG